MTPRDALHFLVLAVLTALGGCEPEGLVMVEPPPIRSTIRMTPGQSMESGGTRIECNPTDGESI